MTSPYILPSGNVQIAFSGGRTSAFMLHQVLAANGDLPDRVEVTFQNTGRELPETLDFVAEVGRRWGVMAGAHPQEVRHRKEYVLNNLARIAGKNLACWCDGPYCHADVLLEIANRPVCEEA